MLQDLRYALRILIKSKGYTAVAVVALALGIGANTALFSVADAFLLKPVAVPDPGRLVMLMERRPGQSVNWTNVASADYFDWKRESQSFAAMSPYQWYEVNLTGSGDPERLEIARAAANFFDVLGAAPMLGRTFLAEEDQTGKNQVAVLSYGLWQRRFGSDPATVGRTIKLDGLSHIVIGVMGKNFNFPVSAELWVPLVMEPKESQVRGSRYLQILAKLKPGASLRQASAEMSVLGRRLSEQYPETHRGWSALAIPLRYFVAGDLTYRYTTMSMVAVAFVLLIACANVANLQFARGAARQRELAVRTAMGANRRRVVRQLLTESLLLSMVGAFTGLAVAEWGVELILHYMPPDIARYLAGWYEIRLDTRAFAFALACAVASGIISGLAPALRSSKPDLNETLKESGRGTTAGRSRQRVRSVLVISELALALVLLIGAGLMVRGARSLTAVNRPYSPEHVLSVQLNLSDNRYENSRERAGYYDRVLTQLQSVLAIESAALVTSLPYGDGAARTFFQIEGRPLERGEERWAQLQTVSAGYFNLMRIPLREGRVLSESDGEGKLPVAVISENLARRYWPGQSAIGRRIQLGVTGSDEPWLTIVGVAADIRYDWVEKELTPAIYRSYRQGARGWATLAVRAHGDPMAIVPAVRAQFAKVDPDQPLAEIKTLKQVVSDSLLGFSYVTVIMTVLGIIALALSAVGVSGLMAYSVAERTHEIGVRLALGASREGVLRLLVAHGMLLAGIGLGIGFIGAVLLARLLSEIIFGVSALDWSTFSAVLTAMAVVSLGASYIPSRRAARLDPTMALRHE